MPREKLAVLACVNVALLFLIVALLLAAPAVATAACPPGIPGRTVGPSCSACWDPVTTNTDGTPVAFPISYRLYVYQGTLPVPGQTPPKITTSANENVPGVCAGLTPGQHYNVTVTAVEAFAPTDLRESALAAPFPFVFDRPGKIAGAGLR